ncbi:MAG: 3-phosphoshikimate 1-carboxyvinyltransferase, partial [Amnibacterium sp.]
RPLPPVDLDLAEGGELAPTLVGLAAFADGPSTFRGIGHLRGHETDRLAALATELTAVGAATEETDDGLVVTPGPLAATRPWRAYADHRMATTGALLGLAVPGLVVDDIASTGKTMPDFPDRWGRMLG